MRAPLAVTNLLMAGFLIVWAAVDIAHQLALGLDLGPVPFVAAALGFLGLLGLVFSADYFAPPQQLRRRPRATPVVLPSSDRDEAHRSE